MTEIVISHEPSDFVCERGHRLRKDDFTSIEVRARAAVPALRPGHRRDHFDVGGNVQAMREHIGNGPARAREGKRTWLRKPYGSKSRSAVANRPLVRPYGQGDPVVP